MSKQKLDCNTTQGLYRRALSPYDNNSPSASAHPWGSRHRTALSSFYKKIFVSISLRDEIVNQN